jgi:hypothetical protein
LISGAEPDDEVPDNRNGAGVAPRFEGNSDPPSLSEPHRKENSMNRLIMLAVMSSVLLAFIAPSDVAARGGKPNGALTASCSVSGTTVSATGLPTDQVINFMISDSNGTRGWVLGYTWDGTFSTSVPAPNGPTSYAFVSRTWGPDGSKYSVFASCSA